MLSVFGFVKLTKNFSIFQKALSKAGYLFTIFSLSIKEITRYLPGLSDQNFPFGLPDRNKFKTEIKKNF